MDNSMKEGLMLAVALGLAIAAAQAFRVDQTPDASALHVPSATSPVFHPYGHPEFNHRLLSDRR